MRKLKKMRAQGSLRYFGSSYNDILVKQKDEATRIKDVSKLTDEELMNLYCQGDNVAYAELFKRYTPRLVGFLTRFVGPTQAGDV